MSTTVGLFFYAEICLSEGSYCLYIIIIDKCGNKQGGNKEDGIIGAFTLVNIMKFLLF